jgi:hypothetical protein
MADSSSSFVKWIGGILAAIITGFILWWLTGPFSPFNQSHVVKKADVAITSFSLVNPIYTGTVTTCNFEITNQGSDTANGCQLIWETTGSNGTKTSDQFNLELGGKKHFPLRLLPLILKKKVNQTSTLLF